MQTLTVNLYPVASPDCPIDLHCREIGAAVLMLAARCGVMQSREGGGPAHGLAPQTYTAKSDRITHAFGVLDPVATPIIPWVIDLTLAADEWAAVKPVVIGAVVRAAYAGKLDDLDALSPAEACDLLRINRSTWHRHRTAILQVAEAATIRATKARDALPRRSVA